MDIIDRLDDARGRCNVLEHRFYERWSAGELSVDELRCYAGEYGHVVLALAQCSRQVIAQAPPEHRRGLAQHAREEESHVALWSDFAEALGAPGERSAGRSSEQPLAQTLACVSAWTASEDVLESLATLYAIEAGQPQISHTKLDGLAEHYGIAADSPGAAYFELHAQLDVEHADAACGLISALMPHEDASRADVEERMLGRARAALEGNWLLLDGVQGQSFS